MRAAPRFRESRLSGRLGVRQPSAGAPLELVFGSLLLTLTWGMAQPVIKGAYGGLTPFGLIWMRCSAAVLTLTIYSLLLGAPDRATHKSAWKEKGHRALSGLLHNVYIWFLYQGMFGTAAARASVLLYSQPIWVMLLGAAFLSGERVTPARAAGFALAMGGTVTVFSNRLGADGALWADSYILLAAVLWAAQTIHYRRCLWNSDVVSISRWAMLIGAPAYFLLASSDPGFGILSFGGAQILAVVYMGVASSALLLAYWGYLLLKYSPARVSVFLFLNPIVGVLGSALYLGERVSWRLAAGAALTAAGVWLVTGEKRGGRKA